MKKNMLLITSFAFLGTIALATATAILSNNKSLFTTAVDNNTVGHTITFSTNDTRITSGASSYAGIVITKENATRSGFPFTIGANVVGKDAKDNSREDCLLYCETKGEEAIEPNHYFEMYFSLKDVASFESVVLKGQFYTNNTKTEYIESCTYTLDGDICKYDEYGQIYIYDKFFYKAFITSIDINYTCSIY